MPLIDFTLTRLSEDIDVSSFDCDDKDINEFLNEDAMLYQNEQMANTYLFIRDSHIGAFFSISNDCLNDMGVSKEFENKAWNKFHRKADIPNPKRIRSYPSIKIGRLGVCRTQHKNGLAYELMDFIKGFSILELKPACRLLLLDAYNKPRQITYYKNNGFDFTSDDDAEMEKRTMFYSLCQIK